MKNHTFSSIDTSALEHVTGGVGDSNANWGNLMTACANSKGASSANTLSGSDWSACSSWARGVANGQDPAPTSSQR